MGSFHPGMRENGLLGNSDSLQRIGWGHGRGIPWQHVASVENG